MMREYQVRICERLGVKFPGPTRHLRRFGCVAAMSDLPPDSGRGDMYWGWSLPDADVVIFHWSGLRLRPCAGISPPHSSQAPSTASLTTCTTCRNRLSCVRAPDVA